MFEPWIYVIQKYIEILNINGKFAIVSCENNEHYPSKSIGGFSVPKYHPPLEEFL
jgi:hypothetical protein